MFSGLQSMAAGGVGGAAAAKAIGGALGAGLFLTGRGRGQDGEEGGGENGGVECKKQMSED